jgi:signal transduction histidine kinase
MAYFPFTEFEAEWIGSEFAHAQAFKDNIVTEDSTDYYSEVILDETDKMSDLITRMLELTELESDYVKVNEDKFCISALTDHIVIKFFSASAAKK